MGCSHLCYFTPKNLAVVRIGWIVNLLGNLAFLYRFNHILVYLNAIERVNWGSPWPHHRNLGMIPVIGPNLYAFVQRRWFVENCGGGDRLLNLSLLYFISIRFRGLPTALLSWPFSTSTISRLSTRLLISVYLLYSVFADDCLDLRSKHIKVLVHSSKLLLLPHDLDGANVCIFCAWWELWTRHIKLWLQCQRHERHLGINWSQINCSTLLGSWITNRLGFEQLRARQHIDFVERHAQSTSINLAIPRLRLEAMLCWFVNQVALG